jgi:hypothetical protein
LSNEESKPYARIAQDREDVRGTTHDSVQLAWPRDGPTRCRDLELTAMERVVGVTWDDSVPDDVVLKRDAAHGGEGLARVVDDPTPRLVKSGHGLRLD